MHQGFPFSPHYRNSNCSISIDHKQNQRKAKKKKVGLNKHKWLKRPQNEHLPSDTYMQK
jgi:hypothetical protein